MAELMGDMMRGAAVNAVESVMDSGAMQVRAMFVHVLDEFDNKHLPGGDDCLCNCVCPNKHSQFHLLSLNCPSFGWC